MIIWISTKLKVNSRFTSQRLWSKQARCTLIHSSLIFTRLWSLFPRLWTLNMLQISHIRSQCFREKEWMNILSVHYMLSYEIKRIILQTAIKDFLSTTHDLRLNLVPTITIVNLKNFLILSSNGVILHLYK